MTFQVASKIESELQYNCTRNAVETGVAQFWVGLYPNISMHSLDCTHRGLLDKSMIGLLGRLINEHARLYSFCYGPCSLRSITTLSGLCVNHGP